MAAMSSLFRQVYLTKAARRGAGRLFVDDFLALEEHLDNVFAAVSSYGVHALRKILRQDSGTGHFVWEGERCLARYSVEPERGTVFVHDILVGSASAFAVGEEEEARVSF